MRGGRYAVGDGEGGGARARRHATTGHARRRPRHRDPVGGAVPASRPREPLGLARGPHALVRRSDATLHRGRHSPSRDRRRRLLAELGAGTDDVAYAAADITVDDVCAALAAAGHDSEEVTLFLVEGLLVYLDEGVIRTLLRALRSVADPRSRLAVSMSRAQTDSFIERVARAGEPARTFFDEESAAAMLAACGWDGNTSRAVVLATPL
jgi:hypothetical protein